MRNVFEKGENIARLVALQAFLLKLGDHFKRTQPQTITAVGGHGIIYIRDGYDRSVVVNVRCVQTERITASVTPLVMHQGSVLYVRIERLVFKQLVP